MTRVALLTPVLMKDDAVSNDVIGMSQVLQKHGHDVAIFCDSWESDFDPVALYRGKLNSFLKTPEDVLIYHFSVGWDYGIHAVTHFKCKVVIKYHNITPPEFFLGINSIYVDFCRAGRNQLTMIANAGCSVFLSDSAYNMRELIAEGADVRSSYVVPPFLHSDWLAVLEADLTFLDSIQDGKINILMVGRLAPNKGHLKLLEAFATYYRNYNRQSRLIIVGKEDPRLQGYVASLYKKAATLGIVHAVMFTGVVSQSVLKACYLGSHVFMIISEHEGFCVPLVEAMFMKLPIVALASSAVTETIESGGLVWKDFSPFLFAESIDRIAKVDHVRMGMGRLGRDRYQAEFSPVRVEHKFLEALQGVL